MAVPPVTVGAVQVTVAVVPSAVAATAVGTPGVVTGITAALAVDAVPVPTALTGLTRKV